MQKKDWRLTDFNKGKKWYAIIESVLLNKLDRASDSRGEVEVINVKVNSKIWDAPLSFAYSSPDIHMYL